MRPALTAIILPITCQAPAPQPGTRTFLISEMMNAARKVAHISKVHPSWPQARVRSTVARELAISTVQLRYLLRKAAEQEQAAQNAN